ncbi:MAG TPA: hypothetical protein VIJ94_09895 [Caulobacteraceae bacterium]
MGYKAKSSLAGLAALALVYGSYFLWALAPGHTAHDDLAHMVGAAIGLTIILIILEIIIAVRDRSPAARVDERDSIVGLRSARNGYYALVGMIWWVPIVALLGAPAVLLANLSLGMLVLAEMVHFGSRVIYDRVGG